MAFVQLIFFAPYMFEAKALLNGTIWSPFSVGMVAALRRMLPVIKGTKLKKQSPTFFFRVKTKSHWNDCFNLFNEMISRIFLEKTPICVKKKETETC